MINHNFKWQAFEKTGGKFRNVKISINKSGGIGFLAGFCHQYQLQDKTHVVLCVSQNLEAIGFQFTKDARLPGAYKLTKNRSSASVSPNAFWAAYGINRPWDYAGLYTPQVDENKRYGRLFYILLKNKIS